MKPIYFLSIILYSCSTSSQIPVTIPPTQNQNFASKSYVDSLINGLKVQRAQDKFTIDSLKNYIIINTIKVDTSSGSDFNFANGVMTFNKPNLDRMINVEILKHTPVAVPKTIIKIKKRR